MLHNIRCNLHINVTRRHLSNKKFKDIGYIDFRYIIPVTTKLTHFFGN